MPTLSKMYYKCEKCKEKDTCKNKRMVACAVAEIPQSTVTINTSITVGSAAQLLRDTSINAKIAEQIKKELCKNGFGFSYL